MGKPSPAGHGKSDACLQKIHDLVGFLFCAECLPAGFVCFGAFVGCCHDNLTGEDYQHNKQAIDGFLDNTDAVVTLERELSARHKALRDEIRAKAIRLSKEGIHECFGYALFYGRLVVQFKVVVPCKVRFVSK